MKNLSKRNKIVVGIVGIVIVVIAAGIALVRPGGSGLFGASVALKISPPNPTVAAGQTVTLSVAPTLTNCQWSANSETGSASSGAVSLSPTTGTSTVARGVSAGTATVNVTCSAGTGSTTVTVTPPPTPTPPVISPASSTFMVGQSVTLSTGDSSCRWATSVQAVGTGTEILRLSVTTGASTVVTGMAAGFENVGAVCAGGAAVAYLTVTAPPPPPPIISPANPSVVAGQSVTLTASPGDSSCRWYLEVLGNEPVGEGPTLVIPIPANTPPASFSVIVTCTGGSASTTVTVR